MPKTADLHEEIAALKAMLIAADARDKRKDERIARLEKLVAAFNQAVFGRKSEKSDPDQFELALEDLETAMAVIHAEDHAAKRPAKQRSANRGSLPKHLPRIEEVIEPDSLTCACGGCLHCIGEDVSERLDIVPAQFRVIVTRRPKYACRSCTDGVAQAAAPARLIPGGMPTEATVALVLVSKFADHLPLYRQAQIYSRQGVDLDRSTLADWVGPRPPAPVYPAICADRSWLGHVARSRAERIWHTFHAPDQSGADVQEDRELARRATAAGAYEDGHHCALPRR
jgi:transposase